MWETVDFIVRYVIEQGGLFGLLIILSFGWIGFREWSLIKNKKKESDSSNSKLEDDTSLIKERQETQMKAIELSAEKLDEINQKLQDISNHIDSFVKTNDNNAKKIEKLTEQLQQVNDERVEELKELLGSYHKTMNELSLTLQTFKFVLKTRLGED